MSHTATALSTTLPGSEEPQPEPADPCVADGDGQTLPHTVVTPTKAETTDEGVPPESIGDIVTALLASMWLAGPSESDPAPPPVASLAGPSGDERTHPSW